MKQLIRFGPNTQYQKDRACEFIQNLEVTEKCEFESTVKQYKESKSADQLGYYFVSVVRVAAEWQGMTPKTAHEFLKKNCCYKVYFSDLSGNSYEYRPSIADMNLKPMAEYIDLCINFLGSNGQYVPPPTTKG
jgi:hypothetical protein